MNKGDESALRTEPGLFIDEANASSLQFSELRFEIDDFDAQMMDARPAFGNELAHRRLFACCLQQLDAALADRKHGYTHALIGDDFDLLQIESEAVPPKAQGLIDRIHGNAEM